MALRISSWTTFAHRPANWWLRQAEIRDGRFEQNCTSGWGKPSRSSETVDLADAKSRSAVSTAFEIAIRTFHAALSMSTLRPDLALTAFVPVGRSLEDIEHREGVGVKPISVRCWRSCCHG